MSKNVIIKYLFSQGFKTVLLQENSNNQIEGSLLQKLFTNSDFTDVTLVSGDNQHIAAHRAILGASSPFLKKIFYESLHQNTFFYLGLVDHGILQAMLQFIYLGRCEEETEHLVELKSLASQLRVTSLEEAIKVTKNDPDLV